MTFNFDILLLMIAIFSLLSGLYFGFFNQLRRTLTNAAGMLVAIILSDTIYGILSGIGSLQNIVVKVVKFIFADLTNDLAFKLFIIIIIYLVVKLFVYLFVGIFKGRGVKSFLKDKTAVSSLVGGVLGIVNAYVIGLLFYILFSCATNLSSATVSTKLFTLIPNIKELIEALAIH